MAQMFDVVIVGGGTAGVVAALQAAREGCRTLLVERNGQPGGTMSSALIAYPGLFFAWKKQIIAGIGWELVTGCAELAGTELPHFEEQIGMKNHPRYQVRLNPFLYAAFCDEKMSDAGVRRLYHTMVLGIERKEGVWQLDLCSIDGVHAVSARVVIDCTGDASVAGLAGFERNFPEQIQPCTYSCRVSGYDPEQLNYTALAAAADAAVREGKLRYTDIGWNNEGFSEQFVRNFGDNANHLSCTLPSGSEGRSDLEVEARASLLRAYRFLRSCPGLENLKLDFAAAECGVRESATIVGEHQITGEEYRSGFRFPDAVCFAFYPVDLHELTPQGVIPKPLEQGVTPTIPLRALIPRKSRDFLVAGRCLSSDRAANCALRVQAASMASAQAAGAAAVLAVRSGGTPGGVALNALKRLLQQHCAIVP